MNNNQKNKRKKRNKATALRSAHHLNAVEKMMINNLFPKDNTIVVPRELSAEEENIAQSVLLHAEARLKTSKVVLEQSKKLWTYLLEASNTQHLWTSMVICLWMSETLYRESITPAIIQSNNGMMYPDMSYLQVPFQKIQQLSEQRGAKGPELLVLAKYYTYLLDSTFVLKPEDGGKLLDLISDINKSIQRSRQTIFRFTDYFQEIIDQNYRDTALRNAPQETRRLLYDLSTPKISHRAKRSIIERRFEQAQNYFLFLVVRFQDSDHPLTHVVATNTLFLSTLFTILTLVFEKKSEESHVFRIKKFITTTGQSAYNMLFITDLVFSNLQAHMENYVRWNMSYLHRFLIDVRVWTDSLPSYTDGVPAERLSYDNIVAMLLSDYDPYERTACFFWHSIRYRLKKVFLNNLDFFVPVGEETIILFERVLLGLCHNEHQYRYFRSNGLKWGAALAVCYVLLKTRPDIPIVRIFCVMPIFDGFDGGDSVRNTLKFLDSRYPSAVKAEFDKVIRSNESIYRENTVQDPAVPEDLAMEGSYADWNGVFQDYDE